MTDSHEYSTYYLKYLEYCERFNTAIDWFESAEKELEAGAPHTSRYQLVLSWHNLFLAEEAIYIRKQSPRQKEVQRLWQQRGLLERTRANLNSVNLIDHHPHFRDAILRIGVLIADNKYKASTIKERIPK